MQTEAEGNSLIDANT